jgi:hypothetical protein
MTTEQKFDEWAIVDVMGHQRFVGRVTEQVVAGQGFVRVDIPATEKVAAWTKLIGPGSIYAITPVTKDVAIAMAEKRNETPITPFDFTADMIRKGNRHRNIEFQDDDYEEEFDPA